MTLAQSNLVMAFRLGLITMDLYLNEWRRLTAEADPIASRAPVMFLGVDIEVASFWIPRRPTDV